MDNSPHDSNGIEIRPGDRVEISVSLGDNATGKVKVLETSTLVTVDVDGVLGRPISVSASRCTILGLEAAQSTPMEMVTYKGKLAAIVSAERIRLDPEFEQLPQDHPDRRMVAAMALYARDVAAGELEGPYDPDEAERYAREILEADGDVD